MDALQDISEAVKVLNRASYAYRQLDYVLSHYTHVDDGAVDLYAGLAIDARRTVCTFIQKFRSLKEVSRLPVPRKRTSITARRYRPQRELKKVRECILERIALAEDRHLQCQHSASGQ